MLDDFNPDMSSTASRSRFRRCLAASVVIYGACSAAAVAATRAIVKPSPPPDEVPIEWARPHAEPEASMPSPAQKKDNGGPATPRRLRPPKSLPKDKPAEADRPLTDAVGAALQDRGGGGAGGHPEAPLEPIAAPPETRERPRPMRLTPPLRSSLDERPKYPSSARRKGIEGTVILGFDVLADGRIANIHCLRGPEELCESVLRTAPLWQYRPARRDGMPVAFHMTRTVVFRLDDP